MDTSRIEREAYVRLMTAGYPTTVPTKDGRGSASADDDGRTAGQDDDRVAQHGLHPTGAGALGRAGG
jgi:hypothetical protein